MPYCAEHIASDVLTKMAAPPKETFPGSLCRHATAEMGHAYCDACSTALGLCAYCGKAV